MSKAAEASPSFLMNLFWRMFLPCRTARGYGRSLRGERPSSFVAVGRPGESAYDLAETERCFPLAGNYHCSAGALPGGNSFPAPGRKGIPTFPHPTRIQMQMLVAVQRDLTDIWLPSRVRDPITARGCEHGRGSVPLSARVAWKARRLLNLCVERWGIICWGYAGEGSSVHPFASGSPRLWGKGLFVGPALDFGCFQNLNIGMQFSRRKPQGAREKGHPVDYGSASESTKTEVVQ